MSWCECGKCGEVFTGLGGFDRHQLVDYTAAIEVICQHPASIGMVRNRHGRWALPPDPRKPNPWADRPHDVIPGSGRQGEPAEVSSMADGDRHVKLHTRTGTEITEAQIEAWAAEAQRGYCTTCWKPSPCAQHG